jgi:hypothetical protein
VNLIFALLYSITALIYHAIGRLPAIPPWIPLPEETYYLYSTAEIIAGEPQVEVFINYYLRNVKDVIIVVCYFMPDQDAFEDGLRSFTRVAGQ